MDNGQLLTPTYPVIHFLFRACSAAELLQKGDIVLQV